MTPSQPDTDESPDALARVLDNLTDLKNYIRQRESHLVELKKGAPRTPAGKSAAAMASNEARSVGLIVLGVKEGPPHSFPGLELSDEFARKLRNDITSKVSPPPSVQIWTIHTGDNRSLMCIAIQGDGHRIYEYEGQPYKRIGTENVKLTRGDALEQQVSRSRDRNSWETQTRSGTTELLDPRHVSRFLDAVRDRQSRGRSDQEILSHYGLVSEVGLVSNAAVALFADREHAGRLMPQLLFQAGAFTDVTTLRNPDDAMQSELCVIDQLDIGLGFLKRHLTTKSVIGPDGLRRDVLEIPLNALREILANALVHRDFEASSGRVAVHVDDREVRISSSGSMVPGTNYSFLAAQAGELGSRLRNPVMGRVLYELGIIERWGGGIKTAVDETLGRFLPAPRFRLESDQVTVSMLRPHGLPEWVADAGLSAPDLLVLDCLAGQPLATRELRELTHASRESTAASIQRLIEIGAVELPTGPSGLVARRDDWDGLDFA